MTFLVDKTSGRIRTKEFSSARVGFRNEVRREVPVIGLTDKRNRIGIGYGRRNEFKPPEFLKFSPHDKSIEKQHSDLATTLSAPPRL